MHNYAAAFLDLLNHDLQKYPKAVLDLLPYISVAGNWLLLIVRGFERVRKMPALWNFLREQVAPGVFEPVGLRSMTGTLFQCGARAPQT